MTEAKSNLQDSFGAKFRRNFLAGLLALAPVCLTIYIIVVVIRLLGGFLSPYFRQLAIGLFPSDGPWLKVMTFAADIVAFITTVALIALFGFAVRYVIGKRLVALLEFVLGRIPVIRQIYESLRKFVEIFFGDRTKFKRVVAVKFPTESCWSIAFVTNELKFGSADAPDAMHLTLYVPTTPVPTSGFLVLAQEKDVIPLAISVDEAVKILVSGGTLTPEKLGMRDEV
jgi:uncharacterized membrane protein